MAVLGQLNVTFSDDSEEDRRVWEMIESLKASGYPRARFVKQILASDTARDFAEHIGQAVSTFGKTITD